MFWLILLLSGEPTAQSAPKPINHFTVVGGARYRVAVRGDVFSVFKKSAVVRDTIEERDAQRQAVRQATGCQPVDEMGSGARLRGKLLCLQP